MNKFKIALFSIILILGLFQASYADVVNIDPILYDPKFNLLIIAIGIFVLLGISLLALFGIKYLKNRSKESIIEQTNQQELDQ